MNPDDYDVFLSYNGDDEAALEGGWPAACETRGYASSSPPAMPLRYVEAAEIANEGVRLSA